jgi:hypothetical protein
MEIVLGILLLFGAFTLGAVTSDGSDHDTRATRTEIDGHAHHELAVAASPLQICQASGAAVTYRDLTETYVRAGVQNQTPSNDDESDGWDE